MDKKISRIIEETINHYLAQNIITEKKSDKKEKKDDDKTDAKDDEEKEVQEECHQV